MKALMKITWLFILTLSLTACGFHLRTQPPLPPEFKTLYIKSDDPYGQLTLQLEQILQSMGVKIVDTSKEAPVTLKIFNEQYTTSILSESASSSTKQYTLYLVVQYEILNNKGKILFGPKTVKEQSNYTVNENQVSSTDTQQASLKEEMQRDAVFSILMQLGSKDAMSAISGKTKSK